MATLTLGSRTMARGLGLASVGIGLTELLAPRQLSRFMGLRECCDAGTVRAFGVREVMQGVDLLTHRDPTAGLWARVAGDALDVAALGMAARKSRRPVGLGVALGLVLGIGVLDLLVARRHTQAAG